MMQYDYTTETVQSTLRSLSVLTNICLGENEVLNSQSNCKGEPADHERIVDY